MVKLADTLDLKSKEPLKVRAGSSPAIGTLNCEYCSIRKEK